MRFNSEEYYCKSAHATYRCEYHCVWVPKYRYKILVDDIKSQLRKILMELCEWMEVRIIEGYICKDHVHMYISIPPKHSVSYVMKILKGKSAELLKKRSGKIKPGVRSIWARGYFVSTVGADREVIKNYVRNQEQDQISEDQMRIWRDV